MNLEEMLRSLASDVQTLLRESGKLKSDEKHPVINELDAWHAEDAASQNADNSQSVSPENTGA